jgi:Vitamin K epoxide reductase family
MAGDESRILPEMRHAAFDQRPIPTGWYENPTTWPKRIVLALLALIGFAVALYLSLFQVSALYFPDLQINLVGSVWDPFFDSYEVLDFLHWPDAIPGVLAYGAEVVLNILGDKYRWRTAPWTVIAFGLIIFPAAAVSTVLLIVQPIFVDSWCTLCIVSALVSFVICGLGADEVLATLQHLKRVRDSGGSLKRALWGEGLKGLLSVLSRKREV